MFRLLNMSVNNLVTVHKLCIFYNAALLRKCYESYMLTGKERFGGCTFQVNMRKLIYFTIGGPLRRKARKRNHLNQTITFSSKVAGCLIMLMCPIQFSAGFAS